MIPVIDLFAGPGGLGEGFSSLLDESNKPAFQTIMSIEKDPQSYVSNVKKTIARKTRSILGERGLSIIKLILKK